MNSPFSHKNYALFLAALFFLSAVCSITGGSDVVEPFRTPAAAVSFSRAAVDFQDDADREAFLAKFDTMAENDLKDWNVLGMAVAIVREGTVVFARGYGVKKAGSPDPVTADTVFQIGSTSKAFTAALAAMEVDSGRMNWSDPVITYVPDFQMKDPWVTREFTITDSLAQRSGLPDHWGTELGGLGYSREDMIHALRYVDPVSSFRSTFLYQNIPFVVAAAAIENTSGKSWEDNMKERIFVPLGMTSASTGYDAFMASPDRVSLHWLDIREDGTYGPVVADSSPYMVFPKPMEPAGGINANIRDMADWAIFQLGDGTYNGTRIISRENMEYLHTPRTPVRNMMNSTKDYYCQGWFYKEIQGYPSIVWHNGETYGNHAMVLLVPSEKLGIVVLSNIVGASLPDMLAYKFYDRYFGREDPPEIAGAAARYRQSVSYTASDLAMPQPLNASPPLPLSTYTGTFYNDLYGNATVALNEGNLTVTFGKLPTTYVLAHYDGNDFFAWCPEFSREYYDTVTFETGPDNSVQKMILPIMLRPGITPGFVRV